MSRPEGACHDPCLCCCRACPDPGRRFATARHRAAHARGGLAPGQGDRRLGPGPHGLETPEACLIAILHGLELGLTPLCRHPAHRRDRPPADAVGRRRHGFGARQRPMPMGARGARGREHRGLERHLFGQAARRGPAGRAPLQRAGCQARRAVGPAGAVEPVPAAHAADARPRLCPARRLRRRAGRALSARGAGGRRRGRTLDQPRAAARTTALPARDGSPVCRQAGRQARDTRGSGPARPGGRGCRGG